jgi:hypothetical protein
MNNVRISGIDASELKDALARGIDHGGNAIEVFEDPDGGWPLRCCLTDSAPGNQIAIIAWSPFPWNGAYAETGPVVVHAQPCDGTSSNTLPANFDARPMVLRPYGPDRRIAYDHVRHVSEGSSLTNELQELLDDDGIEFVHARNVTGGCYSFTANRTV